MIIINSHVLPKSTVIAPALAVPAKTALKRFRSHSLGSFSSFSSGQHLHELFDDNWISKPITEILPLWNKDIFKINLNASNNQNREMVPQLVLLLLRLALILKLYVGLDLLNYSTSFSPYFRPFPSSS